MNIEREKPRIISRGSSFRYSGRTQKQMQEHVRENFVKRQSFQRHVRSLHGSTSNVGNSISAQPLLPVGDSDLANRSVGDVGLNNNVETATEITMKRQSSIQPSSPQSNYMGSSDCGEVTITDYPLSSSQPNTSHSTPIHSGGSGTVPPSPFRLMREESVDGTLSPVSFKGGVDTLDTDTGRRKRHPTDKAYFIAKELLMTERTYKKDLEVLNLWFRDEVSKEEQMPEETLTLLFSHIDPLYELHAAFLKDIEQRMATWEGRGNAHLTGDYRKIGDVVLKNFNQTTLDHYNRYIDTHLIILDKLEVTIHKNTKFEQVYRDFEMQKVCYLPLTTLLLKPLHRVLHYQLLLERLLNHYGSAGHQDYPDTNMALTKVRTIIKKLSTKLKESENFVKLMELQRDLVGYDSLVQSGREFVREGCLQKLSQKGYQQRMFFLFSDMLLYANRTTTGPGLQFRVHGKLAVPELQVVDSEPRLGADFCFNIYDGKRALMVAASSQSEKLQWMDDISETVQYARERGLDSPTNKYMSLKSISGSDDGLDRSEMQDPRSLDSRPSGQRSNSSVHVCWHRATSVAIMDHQRALENQLSGYLLRKFKNSNGWQKLWVVFTNFCLYFYKTFQDDFPLASLPLLGYHVDVPTPQDDINKDYVFKLQFKNHVYFFRAESQFTFDRWMEVLSSATKPASNTTVLVNGIH